MNVTNLFFKTVLITLLRELGTGLHQVGSYEVKVQDKGFEFWKIGEEKIKTTEISNNGDYIIIRTQRLWTSSCIGELGLKIHEIHKEGETIIGKNAEEELKEIIEISNIIDFYKNLKMRL